MPRAARKHEDPDNEELRRQCTLPLLYAKRKLHLLSLALNSVVSDKSMVLAP
jgi:hypothetical protein